MKKLKNDSYLIQLPKNAFQYLIGFSFYLIIFGELNILRLIIGLTAFLLTYSSIYHYNDLMDYEEDRKSSIKRTYKALARGDLTKEKVISRMIALFLSGIALGALIGGWYVLLLLGLLATNYLHSSPRTKKLFKYNLKYLFPNMFIMQFLKFTSGWFTFTTNLTLLPSWIIACLCTSYIFGYVIYKRGIANISKFLKKKLKLSIALSTIVLITFFISLIIYPFKIPLLAIIPISFIFLVLRKEKSQVKRFFGFLKIIHLVIFMLLVFILLLNVPVVGEINEETGRVIDTLSTLSLKNLDNESLKVFIQINNTLYDYPIKDLKDLEALINLSIGTIRIKE